MQFFFFGESKQKKIKIVLGFGSQTTNLFDRTKKKKIQISNFCYFFF